MLLTIHTDHPGPRLAYTLDLIFGRWLGLSYRLAGRAEYLAAEGPCLHYGQAQLRADELFIPACSLLFETGLRPLRPEVRWQEEQPFFFSRDCAGADFGFDLIALIFYCVSRYEEYGPFQADEHGRFPAGESLAARQGFLDLAIVDRWLEALRRKLQRRFPALPLPPPVYQFHPTYDIDLAWAYRHRPFWRQAGGWAKDLLRGRRDRFVERVAVLSGGRTDPFFTFPYLDERHERYRLAARFFFLLAPFGRYDRGIEPGHPALGQLIRDLAGRYETGIHPSYDSFQDADRIRLEKETLEGITGRPVRHSRQHYLRLVFPATYHALLAAGIRHDYSLGYADASGFRAGTARSFLWYDLSEERSTDLLIHPFQVMEVSLRKYRQLTAAAAPEAVFPLIREVRRFGGTFRTLWHNSTFAASEGWEGWREVYEAILREAVGKTE